ncbi:MAG: SRPBCC domain-containing protein [Saprospiraceae bacterium]|nr:SRPBCC domain-containing protein [Saprospiraceae bacterium]MBK7789370.1 SRPBCC domain-containing protein [Saprospiraceae bacterium]MBK8112757.1 SRPBCC domain-containing protein [Saprospiraceae bacterium]
MELKTKVQAEPGRQEIFITRHFDLPVDLVFRAYTEADLLAQWMGTKVITLENKRHGSWQIETSDPNGNVVFKANGVIHEIETNSKITRTFEMENTGFPIQLEYLTFESVSDETCLLTVHTIFKSVTDRDNLLKMPFAFGLSMAHDRLQNLFTN